MKSRVNWTVHLVELIVVIIGVSIAFQLSNWKESTRNSNLEKEYIHGFVTDLEDDIKLLTQLIDTSKYYLKMNEKLTNTIVRLDYDNDSLFYYVISLYSYSEFISQDNTYESWKSSVGMDIISDFKLRKKITTLYNFHYKNLRILDGFQRTHQFDRIGPYINRNVRFTGRPVLLNTDFLDDNYFTNLTFSARYSLANKIRQYELTREKAEALKTELEQQI
ncbi:MAG: DUF6090 family protein [Bacteroidota bacterium]